MRTGSAPILAPFACIPNSTAHRAARSVGARAFALGQHVTFAPGYQPEGGRGRQLLGHELAHTVQHQRRSAPPGLVQRAPDDERQGPPAATFSVGLGGILFSPTEDVPFEAGDRRTQLLAIGIRSLIRDAYYPGVVQQFAQHYRRRFGRIRLVGDLRGDEPKIPQFNFLPDVAFTLMRWLDDGGAGDVHVYLTDEQRDLIALAMGANHAWEAVQSAAQEIKLGIPAWFDRTLFFSEIASRRKLLRAFIEADDRYQQHRTGDARRAVLEAAAEIFRSMANGLMVLEAVRKDRALLASPDTDEGYYVHFMYVSIWPATPASAGQKSRDVLLRKTTAQARDPIDSQMAAQFLSFLRTQPAYARDSLTESKARYTLLYRFANFLGRAIRPWRGPEGDQQLTDDPTRLASDPPHPCHLSSYPVLQPPFYDAATDTSYQFHMSVHFPTLFDAFSTYSYRFDRIRVNDSEFVSGVSEETKGDAPSWGEVYGAEMSMATRYASADIRRGIDRFGREWGMPGAEIGTAGIVAVMRYVGVSIKTLFKIITEPAYEATFILPEEGLYVIRCQAIRHNPDDAEVTRPPSVAYLPVLARSPREMAEQRVLAAARSEERDKQRLQELQNQLSEPVSWVNQEELEAERDALMASLGTAKDLYTHQQAEIGRELTKLEAQIIAPYERSDSRAQTMLRIHPLAGRAKQLREQLKQINQILDTRSRRWEKHEISESKVERLKATFVSDQGHVFNMMLEVVDQTPPGTDKPKTYYVADATTPSGRDEMGTGDDRVAAILAGLKPMLEEGDGYGRGELAVMIDGQIHYLRIEAGSTKLLMEALENLATIASIAAIVAAPFTGGTSLYLLIPIGVIGAIPSAYRLSQRIEDETFRWDLAAVMDLVNIVGAAVGIGQVAAGTRMIRLGKALMITGFGTDGLSMVMLQIGIMEQINSTRGLPEGERKARIAEIVGGALFQFGITAAGSLASRRYQQHAEAGAGSVAEPPVSRADVDADPVVRSSMAGSTQAPVGPTQARARQADPYLPPRTDPNSPEHLFDIFEMGIEPTLPPSSHAPIPLAGPESRSTIQRGIKSPYEAYSVYNQALAVADRREVAIYYNRDTKEYMVRIGTETEVAAYGRGWYPIVHYHPNPSHALTFRLPSQMDFDSMLMAAGNGPVRQFVEYDIPGVGRGRTEFGIDLSSSEPVYVRINHPSGDQQTIRFRNTGEYATYWGERAVYVEPGSATHQQMIDDVSQWIRERRGQSGELEAPEGTRSSMTGTSGRDPAREAAAQRNFARNRNELDAWLRHGTDRGAALPEPPRPEAVRAAIERLERNQAQPGDLSLVIEEAVADMRALLTLSQGGMSPSACAGYCNLAAKGVVPTTVLALLEKSGVRVQVDAIAANVLATSVVSMGKTYAAHQFGIVRVAGEAYIVDATFAQFFAPGSADLRQGTDVLAKNFLDNPLATAFAHELIGRGYVPLTDANAALYARALGLDIGPPTNTNPGPVARLLLSGDQHYGIIRFESEAGSVRFVEIDPSGRGAPITATQRETRRNLMENVESPTDLVPMIDREVQAQRPAVTTEQQAAIARLQQRLATLRQLMARYGNLGPWKPQ